MTTALLFSRSGRLLLGAFLSFEPNGRADCNDLESRDHQCVELPPLPFNWLKKQAEKKEKKRKGKVRK